MIIASHLHWCLLELKGKKENALLAKTSTLFAASSLFHLISRRVYKLSTLSFAWKCCLFGGIKILAPQEPESSLQCEQIKMGYTSSHNSFFHTLLCSRFCVPKVGDAVVEWIGIPAHWTLQQLKFAIITGRLVCVRRASDREDKESGRTGD